MSRDGASPDEVDLGIITKARNRTARVLQHPWRMRPYRSTESHIVVGGSPRSGTTLIRRILDRHAGICCGPEMNLFVPARFELEPLSALSGIDITELRSLFRESGSQAEMIDAFAARYRALHGKPRWSEKTPMNVRHFGWVLEHFPNARLVHMIRDGRDVVCSSAEHPDRRWVDGRWVWALHPRPLEDIAKWWVRDTGAGMRFRGHPAYHEVRYEDLVADPVSTTRRLCAFLGEPFDPTMLESEELPPSGEQSGEPALATAASRAPERRATLVDARDRGPVFRSSVGRWQRDLPSDRLPRIMGILGTRLAELGYEP